MNTIPVNIITMAPHGYKVGHLVGPTLVCPWANGGCGATWAQGGTIWGPHEPHMVVRIHPTNTPLNVLQTLPMCIPPYRNTECLQKYVWQNFWICPPAWCRQSHFQAHCMSKKYTGSPCGTTYSPHISHP